MGNQPLHMTEQEKVVFGHYNPKYLCRASDGTLMVYDPNAVRCDVAGVPYIRPADLYIDGR